MPQRLILLIALALIAAACGGGQPVESGGSRGGAVDEATPESVAEASLREASPATAAPVAPPSQEANDSTAGVAEPAPPVIDGPPAPDFTLALGNGGTYTLSGGAKPVYLVFWAEW